MKPSINTLFAIIVAGALGAFATGVSASSHLGHAPDTTHQMAPGAHQEMMKEVSVQAEIVAVAADGTAVEIDHQPIPELGWPAMQMSLELEKPELAEGIAAGDQVTVAIKQLSPTQYVITDIVKE